MRYASENAASACRSRITSKAPASLRATSCMRSSSASRRSLSAARGPLRSRGILLQSTRPPWRLDHCARPGQALKRENVRACGIDVAGEQREIRLFEQLRRVAGDHLEPAVRPVQERLPSLGKPPLELGGAPLARALGHLVGGEEELRPRARK